MEIAYTAPPPGLFTGQAHRVPVHLQRAHHGPGNDDRGQQDQDQHGQGHGAGDQRGPHHGLLRGLGVAGDPGRHLLLGVAHPAGGERHPGPPLLAGVRAGSQRRAAGRRRTLLHRLGPPGQRAGQGLGEGPGLLGGRQAAERREVTGLLRLGGDQRGARPRSEIPPGERRAEDGLLQPGLVGQPGQPAERARAGDQHGVPLTSARPSSKVNRLAVAAE